MIKWEYKVKEVAFRDFEKDLNALGSEGWDISAVMEINPSLARVVFRRPLGSEIQMIGVD